MLSMFSNQRGPEEDKVCEAESETPAGTAREEQKRAETVGISCKEASPGWFSLKAYLRMKVQQPWGPLAQRDEGSD